MPQAIALSCRHSNYSASYISCIIALLLAALLSSAMLALAFTTNETEVKFQQAPTAALSY